MKIAVVGTGNVGWPLVGCLSKNPNIKQILVNSRNPERITAMSMDIASANPDGAEKITPSTVSQIGEADITVLTSGVQMERGETAADVLERNRRVTEEILTEISFCPETILITLATPVDDITVFAQPISGLPRQQVFGFGGDLDRNRLEYVLRKRSQNAEAIELIGEHGGNAIPLYHGEVDYPEVAHEVRKFLAKITSLAGPPTNLATALLLAELVETIRSNSGRVHRVCGYHSELQVYLTWPFTIGRSGVQEAQVPHISEQANRDLESLIAKRRNLQNPVT